MNGLQDETKQGDEQRIGLELQLAGVRNVKAAHALPPPTTTTTSRS